MAAIALRAVGSTCRSICSSWTCSPVQGGWQHLPRQLLELNLLGCDLLQLPPHLAGLTQLSRLTLAFNRIAGGSWEFLPRQLEQLSLATCSLHRVPEQLAGLTHLKQLDISYNPIQHGWQHLPRQLQQLDVRNCCSRLALRQPTGVIRGRLTGCKRVTHACYPAIRPRGRQDCPSQGNG